MKPELMPRSSNACLSSVEMSERAYGLWKRLFAATIFFEEDFFTTRVWCEDDLAVFLEDAASAHWEEKSIPSKQREVTARTNKGVGPCFPAVE
ncbi:hypothetical protein FACS1894206_01430 [Deltaproteobacteria bacterium]|nr:hypothetical protein FACS1894206_01430 [Deltaproteobacteria bacterium]